MNKEAKFLLAYLARERFLYFQIYMVALTRDTG